MRNQMKSAKTIALRVLLGLALGFFMFAGISTAAEWQGLHALDKKELTQKIEAFKRELNETQDNYALLKAIGIAYHIKATKDADTFAPKALQSLKKAHELNPEDTVTLCYLGGATTLMANTTWNPIKKSSYANNGIAMMDKAARKDPHNISIRLTRAFNSKGMPDFLDRKDIAIEDFEYIAAKLENNSISLAPCLKKDIYSSLSELYKEQGNDVKAKKYAAAASKLDNP